MTNLAFAEVVEKIAAKHKVIPHLGDWVDKDGCLVCGKCGKHRETIVKWFGGRKKKMPCMCQCEQDDYEQKKLMEVRKQKAILIQQIQSYGFGPSQLAGMHFKFADPTGENVQIAANYAKQFDQMEKEGAGLLFYGNVGTGKTFLAGCIANYLQARYRTAFMTSFERLNRELTAWNREDKTAALARITNCDLLVIDDLGTEEKLLETAFDVVDRRVNTGRPMIITTNLDPRQFATHQVKYKRIFDRVIGSCRPVAFTGKSRRRRSENPEKWQKVDALLGVKS